MLLKFRVILLVFKKFLELGIIHKFFYVKDFLKSFLSCFLNYRERKLCLNF